VEKVPEVFEESEPGDSRNTNATGILAALRLFYAAGAAGEVARSGPLSYDLTDLTRQVLCNIFVDVHGADAARARGHSGARGVHTPHIGGGAHTRSLSPLLVPASPLALPSLPSQSSSASGGPTPSRQAAARWWR